MFDNVRRVSRQLAAYGSADVAVLAINFLLLPVYTRVLSTREYGAFALLLVVEALLKPVYRWGLDAAFLRFYYDCRDDQERRTLAGTVTWFLALANGAILLVLILVGTPLNRSLFGTLDFWPAYVLLVANSFAGNFLFLPLTLLRIQERAARFAALTFVRSFGTILARLVLVVGVRHGVLGLVLADTVVIFILAGALAPTFRRMVAWRWSWPTLAAMLRYGLPQVPHGLLSQTMAMADRFVLGLYLPLREVGVYLIATSIAAVLKLFPVAFEAAWMPFAFDSMRRPDAPRLFARLATYAFGVLALLTLALAGLADHLVVLMVPPPFHAAATVVPIIAVGLAVQSLTWFVATSFNIAKRTRAYPIVTAVGAVASVAGSFLLVPSFGLVGAAVATVAGHTASTATAVYLAQRAYPIPYELSRLAKLAGVSLGVYGAMQLVGGPPTWRSLLVRSALLAIAPAGLFALRFLERHELAELRQVPALIRTRGRRSAKDLPRNHAVAAPPTE